MPLKLDTPIKAIPKLLLIVLMLVSKFHLLLHLSPMYMVALKVVKVELLFSNEVLSDMQATQYNYLKMDLSYVCIQLTDI